jgi:hypothetical protein
MGALLGGPPASDFSRVAGASGIGRLEPPRLLEDEAHGFEPVQARAVLHAIRPAAIAAQRHAVQRGAAARFQIRLVPHFLTLARHASIGQTARMTPVLASLATPLLRSLDAERSHRLAITALRLGLAGSGRADDPRLAVGAMGLSLPNPIGLAAGFDKGATAIRGLRRLGFGAIETGTATLRPQAGNPCPRVFRLEADRAIINRYGLNSAGIEPYVARLAATPRGRIPIGANVGIN